MEPKWDDEQLKKALRGRVPEGPSQEVSQRVWSSIEKTLRERGTSPSEKGWDDASLRGALKGHIPQEVPEEVAERTWTAIEGAIRDGERVRSVEGHGFLWEPALRYAAAVLLLLAGIGSALEYRSYRQEGKVASYLETLLERGQDAEEEGPIWVSALLTEPLDEVGSGNSLDDEEDESIAEEGEAWL